MITSLYATLYVGIMVVLGGNYCNFYNSEQWSALNNWFCYTYIGTPDWFFIGWIVSSICIFIVWFFISKRWFE